VVSAAVAAEAGQLDAAGWNPVHALAIGERDLGIAALEEAGLGGVP
jgi:hypothetical protein